jgi:hypothetical protein
MPGGWTYSTVRGVDADALLLLRHVKHVYEKGGGAALKECGSNVQTRSVQQENIVLKFAYRNSAEQYL